MSARIENRKGRPTFVYFGIPVFFHVSVEGFEETVMGDLEVLVIALREGDICVDNISE